MSSFVQNWKNYGQKLGVCGIIRYFCSVLINPHQHMKRHLSIRILLLLVCSLLSLNLIAQPRNPMRATDDAFFQSDEARRIGDQMLLYQRVTGGWPKNIDMARNLTPEERARIARDKQRDDDSTIDNGATTMQMKYLARLYKQT